MSGYFSQFGQLGSTYLIYDKNSNNSRCFGFIEFVNPDVAEQVNSMEHTVDNKQIITKFQVLKKFKEDRSSDDESFDQPMYAPSQQPYYQPQNHVYPSNNQHSYHPQAYNHEGYPNVPYQYEVSELNPNYTYEYTEPPYVSQYKGNTGGFSTPCEQEYYDHQTYGYSQTYDSNYAQSQDRYYDESQYYPQTQAYDYNGYQEQSTHQGYDAYGYYVENTDSYYDTNGTSNNYYTDPNYYNYDGQYSGSNFDNAQFGTTTKGEVKSVLDPNPQTHSPAYSCEAENYRRVKSSSNPNSPKMNSASTRTPSYGKEHNNLCKMMSELSLKSSKPEITTPN